MECPQCGNKEKFIRQFTAVEEIYVDPKTGEVYDSKNEEIVEVTKIVCFNCNHEGRSKDFG